MAGLSATSPPQSRTPATVGYAKSNFLSVIYGDIELEYKVPKDSTPVAEVAKCVAYCRKVLA